MKHLLWFVVLLACIRAAFAADVIVDATQVAEALKRNVIVWDVRPTEAYAKGHIPGAVSIGDAPKILRDDNTEDFIETTRIEKILGDGGIDPSREIVVYGNRGNWNPYFGLYTVEYFGGKAVRVYHGGIEDWTAAGNPLTSETRRLPAVALKLSAHPGVSVTKGAVNIPYEQNWVDPDTPLKLSLKRVTDSSGMSLKSVAELKRLYAALDPDKEIIVYCQSGARVSESAGVLKLLGFKNVKVYDSSWLGYGNTLDAPAGNETFFNVGLLNSRMAALQARIEQLEKELAAGADRKGQHVL